MQNVFKKYTPIIILFFFCESTTFSQESFVNNIEVSDFIAALKLYNNNAYAAAQKTFIKVANDTKKAETVKADATYYDAMCAIKLNQIDADEKVLNFVANYPNSTKKNKAYFNVANYYFANKKPAYALKWFEKVNQNFISDENKKELNFKSGYSLLVTNHLNLAKDKFLPLINDGKYGNDARYYYGFIAYKLEDYGLAESTLKEIADNESYKAEISYYLLDISFKSGKFDRCITVGKDLLKNANKNDISEISKIIGESYFNLKQYAEAIPYLKAYKGNKGKWTNTDFYILGYAYFKQNDFENAINFFNKIIDEKNAVAQNAYYHLGECYLKINKKLEALNAFKYASEMEFNLQIQEDAYLNYAKLSYEEGNPYTSVAEVLQNFLVKYPNSSEAKNINQLIVSSFIHQQNYQGAIDYLNKSKTQDNKKLLFEVSYYRGLQLFNQQKFEEASTFLETSTKSIDAKVYNNAKYWLAESLFKLQKYDESIQKLEELKKNALAKDLNEKWLIDYHLGYAYFKLENYAKATPFFESFIKQNIDDEQIKIDATTRLADCFYATAKYQNAINNYEILVKTKAQNADYGLYQKAMSKGFLGDTNAKIDDLKNLVNNYEISSLKDDALFQLAISYTKIKDAKNAHVAFDRLISKYNNSNFIPSALVRQGLLYYNDNNNAKALEKFKEVAQKYPNSKEAIQAVSSAKNVYIDTDNLDAYVAWIKTLKFISVSDDELDSSTFSIAEKNYIENINKGIIIRNLERYLEKYPKGNHVLKASYYLANTLNSNNQPNEAMVYYKYVINQGTSEFREPSLLKLSNIYLEKNDAFTAIPFLENLEKEAYDANNILFAQSNLMKAYYETKSYNLAMQYAKKVVSKSNNDENLKADAIITIARTSFYTNDYDTAREYFDAVEKSVNPALKAEALYYNAFFKNLDKAYKKSNEVVQNLIANYSNYKYWGVKSYIIMAKNYYQLNDAYQATFILENVIKNFTEFTDLVNEATNELKIIKENEAKTNNSIITPKQ